MKKILACLSWIIAILGAGSICISTWLIDNYIMFYIGWGLLIVGIICILLTCKKSREFIFNLLDFIWDRNFDCRLVQINAEMVLLLFCYFWKWCAEKPLSIVFFEVQIHSSPIFRFIWLRRSIRWENGPLLSIFLHLSFHIMPSNYKPYNCCRVNDKINSCILHICNP